MAFDRQPILSSEKLLLRPLEADDFRGLCAAASDPETWAGHPARDRYKRDVFRSYFDFLLKNGGTLVAVDRSSDRVIGCSRYYTAPDMTNSISIGFTFLSHRYWGGAWNLELKKLMLGHAFECFDELWFHIGPTNIRSQRATGKLGAEHLYDATLDLGSGPAAWKCYKLTRERWVKHNLAIARQ